MLDGDIVIHGTGGTISRELVERAQNTPLCQACHVEPVAATLTVRRMTGEVTKQLDVCHDCLIKEM